MPRTDRWRYGHGVISLTPRGTFSVFVPLGHGDRRRKICKTLAEARAWIDAEEPGRIDCRFAPDAARAISMLPPGVTLEDAARFWLEQHPDAVSVSLADAWTRYEAERGVSVGKVTMRGYRRIFRDFMEVVGGDRPVSAILRSDVEAFVRGMNPPSRNASLRSLSALFNAFRSMGVSSADNPCSGVAFAKVAHGVPAVLSVEDAASVMSAAAAFPDACAYFALGLFAGIRPQELMRLRPSHVRHGFIVLDGRITKTADARNVRVRPNLATWLERFPIPRDGFRERAVKAAKAAMSVRIPPDAMRHSFATYAYEMSHDAASVAAEMGHVGTEVFFKHYRALASPGDGARFFAIE